MEFNGCQRIRKYRVCRLVRDVCAAKQAVHDQEFQAFHRLATDRPSALATMPDRRFYVAGLAERAVTVVVTKHVGCFMLT
jgi:hypothetical protein